jgi:uncharacterized protein YoaH (UPF0181 family)
LGITDGQAVAADAECLRQIHHRSAGYEKIQIHSLQ